MHSAPVPLTQKLTDTVVLVLCVACGGWSAWLLQPMSREDGTFGDLDADTAYEVLQKFFPTFDPFSSRPAG